MTTLNEVLQEADYVWILYKPLDNTYEVVAMHLVLTDLVYFKNTASAWISKELADAAIFDMLTDLVERCYEIVVVSN